MIILLPPCQENLANVRLVVLAQMYEFKIWSRSQVYILNTTRTKQSTA